VSRHPQIIDVLGKLMRRPFLFPVQFSKAELTDWMAVEGGSFALDHRIVAIPADFSVYSQSSISEDS
jgi:hypothetical protein